MSAGITIKAGNNCLNCNILFSCGLGPCNNCMRLKLISGCIINEINNYIICDSSNIASCGIPKYYEAGNIKIKFLN